MTTLQEEIDTLATSIITQQVTLLTMRRQKWWLDHPEIQSLSYSWEFEGDDNGGAYKYYYPTSVEYTVENNEDEDDYDCEKLRYDDQFPGLDDDYEGEVFTRPEVLV